MQNIYKNFIFNAFQLGESIGIYSVSAYKFLFLVNIFKLVFHFIFSKIYYQKDGFV